MDPSATVNHTTTKHLLISAPCASHLPPISRRSAARSVPPGRRGPGVAASISRTTVAAATVCVGVIRCAGPTATALNCIDTISDCVSGKQMPAAVIQLSVIRAQRTIADSPYSFCQRESNQMMIYFPTSSGVQGGQNFGFEAEARRSKLKPKFWPPMPVGPRGLKISDA